jgi:hypothetical protein
MGLYVLGIGLTRGANISDAAGAVPLDGIVGGWAATRRLACCA